MTITKSELVNRIRKLQAEAAQLASEVDEVLDLDLYGDDDEEGTAPYLSFYEAVDSLTEALDDFESKEFNERFDENLQYTAPHEEEEDITYEELKTPWEKDDTEAQLAWIMEECYRTYPVEEWKNAVLKHIEDVNAATRRSILATGIYRPMLRNPFERPSIF